MSSRAALVACYVTVPSRQVGEIIGRSLVEKRLAACVNIIPGITSIYQWEGAVHQDEELLLMIKSRSALVQAIATDVRLHHPYECPEIISVALGDGHDAYMNWVRAQTTKSTTEEMPIADE